MDRKKNDGNFLYFEWHRNTDKKVFGHIWDHRLRVPYVFKEQCFVCECCYLNFSKKYCHAYTKNGPKECAGGEHPLSSCHIVIQKYNVKIIVCNNEVCVVNYLFKCRQDDENYNKIFEGNNMMINAIPANDIFSIQPI